MKQLESAGFYGARLVPVDSKKLVRRYNDCLEAAGIAPTGLESFHIDGVGWSPEVAAEKHNPTYLCHGPANPLVILLTPDQRNKPHYVSYYSFQRELMNQYFSRFSREVADLTAETGIWLDLDQGLSHYRSPLDLLVVGDITVRTSALGNTQEAGAEQRRLVQEFMAPGDAWFNQPLRTAILESARAHGDLRTRHLDIPEMIFSDTEVFYTRAFNGVYVIRGLATCENLMLFEDPTQIPKKVDEGTRVYPVSNPAWVTLLLSEGILAIDLEWHSANPGELARVDECMLADLICSRNPQLDFCALTSAQRKSHIQRLRGELPQVYFELEVLVRQLKASEDIDRGKLSMEAQVAAAHPRRDMPPLLQDLFWQLLTYLRPTDVWRVFRHNKELFYLMYRDWPESQKQWAIRFLRQHQPRVGGG